LSVCKSVLAVFTPGTYKMDVWRFLRFHFAPWDESGAGPSYQIL